MAVTGAFYGYAFKTALNKEWDWDTDVIKTMLTTVTYVPDKNAHDYKNDVTNEVTGTGYTAGGATVDGKTTPPPSAGTWTIDCNDISWPASTITARVAVMYDSTPATEATRPLIGYWDFGADQSSSASDFTLVIDATGLARITF